MESRVEQFMEQRLEQFADHALDNHFEQHLDQNNRPDLPRCEVTMNNQGGDKLHFNGYSYSKKAISANAIRWTCATPTRSDTRCKGAITTDRERPYHNPRSLVEHNHPPEDSEASIMRDIARAKRRLRRRTFPHPFPFYPWMLPFQQMQEQSGGRDDTSTLEATLGMGHGSGMMDPSEAGPSGYGDDVRVKMEPEWVDAGALEPNCELEGQYEDAKDFTPGYPEDMGGQGDQNYHHMFSSEQDQEQPQSQQLPLIPDAQDPVKLRVPGKPNLTITVAPTRPPPTHATPPLSAPPPLHLLNPLLNRKRGGRPRGSQYGSYSESDDRVTTILTDSIIASQKLEKMGAAGFQHPNLAAVMTASMSNKVKPRSKDPEAVRAAEIVNTAQNRSGPRVNEELEKVHLKLRQEVLALEVQNLKAEREKLKAYRRNVAIRREIMMLHLQLGKGVPSECASSSRGLETVNVFGSKDAQLPNDFSNSVAKDSSPNSSSKDTKLSDVAVSQSQSNQSPKISIRKSLQKANQSPNVSPMSTCSSVKGPTPPPGCSKQISVDKQHDNRLGRGSGLINASKQTSDEVYCDTSDVGPVKNNVDSHVGGGTVEDPLDVKVISEHRNDSQLSETKPLSSSSCQQSVSSNDPGKDDLVPLDSVSSDLSIEMLSEPGSSQWTNQSSAPMTEHEGFDDLQFEGDESYDNTDNMGEFSGGSMGKEPPDTQFTQYSDESASKRRRVENMWEPEDGHL
ncbi:Leucine--tRNA ligase [Frankliniella fusca]|uniref:Leucine--tRNA ligase n=1 Tax=Frankliniella fusca TaxID=407009 RepID=A0AAE1HC09_9NEOP|nr:Leucine--tRNA ligase [Frankliniella fusca]